MFSKKTTNPPLKWSDIISGIMLIIFGWHSLRPDRPVSNWMI
ncbi:MAG: hypothetical protein ACOCWK_07915 [Tangfeifania sp.]